MNLNNAQITSIVTKILVAASAAMVAKYGISVDQWTTDVTDIVALAVGIGATWYAHNFHGNNPPSATPVTKP
jgi:hypothetical protein